MIETVRSGRFEFPILVYGAFNYKCECGYKIKIFLQKGVEGPNNENIMPSPFSIKCPFCDCLGLKHVDWSKDEVFELRYANIGEAVFLLDRERDCGCPRVIIDVDLTKNHWKFGTLKYNEKVMNKNV